MNNMDILRSIDLVAGACGGSRGNQDILSIAGRFGMVCRNAEGIILWEEAFDNYVTTEGKNFLLQQGLSGSGYTAAWYMGLISSVSFSACAVTDTAAQINGSNGWKEVAAATYLPDYASGTRPSATFAAASGGSKVMNAIVFTASAAGTVQGAFISSIATKQSTTGTLYSAGAFGTPKALSTSDTLTVNYTSTLT